MAHLDSPPQEQAPAETNKRWSFLGMDLKKFTSWRTNGPLSSTAAPSEKSETEKMPPSPTHIDKSDRRSFGKVIPSFGRAKTFKRQQSELHNKLLPVAPSPDERRSRSTNTSRRRRPSDVKSQGPRASAPAFRIEGDGGNGVNSPGGGGGGDGGGGEATTSSGDKDVFSNGLVQRGAMSLPTSPVAEQYSLDSPAGQETPIPIFVLGAEPQQPEAVSSLDVVGSDEPVEAPPPSFIEPEPEREKQEPEPERKQQEPEPAREQQQPESEPNLDSHPEPKQEQDQDQEPEDDQERKPSSTLVGEEDRAPPPLTYPDTNETLVDADAEDFSSQYQYPPHGQYNNGDHDEESNYAHSRSDSEYDALIHDELETKWILNLSMHFRDKSKREKFFVTYFHINEWRRVTISVDYRNAIENTLEFDLLYTKFQREKSRKIYEAIRESLDDIQFYQTVTNLKLETTDRRLHVHVVEDSNEIIRYPASDMVAHLGCRRVKERDIEFDSHMSGFVYKVKVKGEVLIKKEIPGPDTVDEFLYEVNALNNLQHSSHVIRFYGVVVDNNDQNVKGLLISYAEKGALIDIIYDHDHTLPWDLRQKWAQQIVAGLSDIHESGFVQGDFTLSNIVIDENNDAKIIDINRRGCPVGWEPPEAKPLLQSNQRISMYIGVKSDLYQLGMVLWALATQEDEPESHKPLVFRPDDRIHRWYCRITEICLAKDPRHRKSASYILSKFPKDQNASTKGRHSRRQKPSHSLSVSEDHEVRSMPDHQQPCQFADGTNSRTMATVPHIATVSPPPHWSPTPTADQASYTVGGTNVDTEYQPQRGRSPPKIPPTQEGSFEPPALTPRFSWHDNNVATGWKDDQHLHEDTMAVVKTDLLEPALEKEGCDTKLTAAGADDVSGNTNAEKPPTSAAEPDAVIKAPSVSAEGATPPMSPGDAGQQVLADEGSKVDRGAEGEGKTGAVRTGREVLASGGKEKNITRSLHGDTMPSSREVETTYLRFGTETVGTGSRQRPGRRMGNTVPDIMVEKPVYSPTGISEWVDEPKGVQGSELRLVDSVVVLRSFEMEGGTSNARVSTGSQPSPRPPASPLSPVQVPIMTTTTTGTGNRAELEVRDPLLKGICGNDTAPGVGKRNSGMFADLEGMLCSLGTMSTATGADRIVEQTVS